MAPSNYINYHRLAHNYTKRPSRPRLRRTGYWPADARGHVWTCAETAACARIDGSAWLGRKHAADIEFATALEDSLADRSDIYIYHNIIWGDVVVV